MQERERERRAEQTGPAVRRQLLTAFLSVAKRFLRLSQRSASPLRLASDSASSSARRDQADEAGVRFVEKDATCLFPCPFSLAAVSFSPSLSLAAKQRRARDSAKEEEEGVDFFVPSNSSSQPDHQVLVIQRSASIMKCCGAVPSAQIVRCIPIRVAIARSCVWIAQSLQSRPELPLLSTTNNTRSKRQRQQSVSSEENRRFSRPSASAAQAGSHKFDAVSRINNQGTISWNCLSDRQALIGRDAAAAVILSPRRRSWLLID